MRKTVLLVIGIALLLGGVLCVLAPEPASAQAPRAETEIGPCDGSHDTLLTTAPGLATMALPITWSGPALPSSSRPELPPGRAVRAGTSLLTVPLKC